MESRKMVLTNLFVEQQKRQRTDLHTQQGKERPGHIESSTKAYILPCAKYTASENSLYDARSST